jgi:hypothetical protein
MPDAAFIVTIGGRNVSDDIVTWEVIDDEESASQLKATLASPDGRYAAAFNTGDDMEIRFGYTNDLSPAASLPVQDQDRNYGTNEHDTVVVIGRDPLSKMAGGKHRGNHKKGTNTGIIESELKAVGLNPEIGAGKTTEHKRPPVMNENSLQVMRKYGRILGPDSGGSQGKQPTSPLGGEKGTSVPGTKMERDQGHSWSSAEGLTKDGKGRDDHRGGNFHNSHASEPLTGELELRGHPKLRAKTVINMVGFGSKDSGTWYVKHVVHKGGKAKPFTTDATLVRGGTGKGGAGEDQPVVMYTDIWNKGRVYVGQRKTNQSASLTIERGEPYCIRFHVRERVQRHRGGGEPKKGKGRGLDIRNELKDFEEGPGSGTSQQGQ